MSYTWVTDDNNRRIGTRKENACLPADGKISLSLTVGLSQTAKDSAACHQFPVFSIL
jgi:hypothetical protein